jgi:hypothetical protein
MHWKHELTKGFRLSDKGVSLEETPAGPPKAAAVKRFAQVTIDDKGAITGTGRIVLGGQEALHWRQLALLEEGDALARDFNDYLAQSLPVGVTGSLDGFDDVAAYDSDLTGRIRLSGSLGSTTAKRLIVPAFLFEARGKHPFVEDEEREVPVDLHYATMEEDEVVYHLSPAAKLNSLPRDEDYEWAGRIGFSTRFKQADGGVTVKRTFIRTAAVIDPSLYSNLRYSYKRVSNADQQQLVFDRTDQATK